MLKFKSLLIGVGMLALIGMLTDGHAETKSYNSGNFLIETVIDPITDEKTHAITAKDDSALMRIMCNSDGMLVVQMVPDYIYAFRDNYSDAEIELLWRADKNPPVNSTWKKIRGFPTKFHAGALKIVRELYEKHPAKLAMRQYEPLNIQSLEELTGIVKIEGIRSKLVDLSVKCGFQL